MKMGYNIADISQTPADQTEIILTNYRAQVTTRSGFGMWRKKEDGDVYQILNVGN